MIRLDKYIAGAMDVSRSQAAKMIGKGKVTAENRVIRDPACKVDPEQAQICVNGMPCQYEVFHYYMLHKPAGVVCATSDRKEKTVMELLGLHNPRLFPVGRLDKDTEGLLLITDDGALSHRLLSPKSHVDKCYQALLNRPATGADIEAFARGMDIGEKNPALPALLQPDDQDPSRVRITLKEGKYHQIKRMMEARGKQVLYLKRISMGSLCLDPSLAPGDWRPLTAEEIRGLQESTHEIQVFANQ